MHISLSVCLCEKISCPRQPRDRKAHSGFLFQSKKSPSWWRRHGDKQQAWLQEQEAKGSHLEPQAQSRERGEDLQCQKSFISKPTSSDTPLKCPPKADTNWDQVSRCQTMGDISFTMICHPIFIRVSLSVGKPNLFLKLEGRAEFCEPVCSLIPLTRKGERTHICCQQVLLLIVCSHEQTSFLFDGYEDRELWTQICSTVSRYPCTVRPSLAMLESTAPRCILTASSSGTGWTHMVL